MRIALIGTGYVGLVTGACLAERGHHVVCVDKLTEKIEGLQQGQVPLYEPGLHDLLERNASAGRLQFTTDLTAAVQQASVIFIAVGTPPGPDGDADLSHVRQVARHIAQAMPGYRLIVNKSTVPVGTGDLVADILAAATTFPFDVVANPEFLREGAAVEDCLHPDRIVIGARTQHAFTNMREIYRAFDCPIVETDLRSAELTKYASNAFLATKISFINEMANLCDQMGADIEQVSAGMGLDPRIGPRFLKAGIGYGGSCFPKDAAALTAGARQAKYDLKILPAAMEVNRLQRQRVLDKLTAQVGDLQGKHIALLGLAFKPHTDDVRESPAIDLVAAITRQGGRVRAYDPQAMPAMRRVLADSDTSAMVTYGRNVYETCQGTHGILLVTDWPEFAHLDWQRIAQTMQQQVLVDGRNLLEPEQMRSLGFTYAGVGRGVLRPAQAAPGRRLVPISPVPRQREVHRPAQTDPAANE